MQLFEEYTLSNNTDVFANLSQLSNSETTENHKQAGGFFGLFGEQSKVDKAVLEAVRLKKYDIVEFCIDHDLITSYACKDDNGNTLLHYLALDYESTGKLINKLLKHSDVYSFINIQNNNGDTPLILSVIGSEHDLCEKLIRHGADKTIKNKQEYHVDSETDMMPVELMIKSFDNAEYIDMNDTETSSDVWTKQHKIFNPVTFFKSHKQLDHATSEPYTFVEPMTESNIFQKQEQEQEHSSSPMNTEQFIELITNKLHQKKEHHEEILTDDLLNKLMKGGDCGCGSYSDNQNSTEYLLNELQSKMSQPQKGGDCASDTYSSTESLINTLKNSMDNQNGGVFNNDINDEDMTTDQLVSTLRNYQLQGGKGKSKKKHATGLRALPKFVDSAAEENDGRGFELSRIINNQTDEIIENIVKKIQEIIIKNKDDFKKVSADVAKGSQEVARIYKTALWSQIRNDEKNLAKSSLDVAVEVQKIVSKENLLKVDFAKWAKIIEDKKKEKEEARNAKMTQESSTISLSSDSDDSKTSSFNPDSAEQNGGYSATSTFINNNNSSYSATSSF